jgi:hypothetical protein
MTDDNLDFHFSQNQREGLASVLDEIIPASQDGALPAAGELGLARYIEEVAQRSPGLGPSLVDGLCALDELAADREDAGDASRFAMLPQSLRAQVLETLGATHPGFLPALIFHTYMGYYQNPRVLSGHGVAPRPPHPEGYDMGADDLSLLDAVRARPKLYREP